eukprot:7096274-Pyramimonas_sp.AAC.1
MWCNRRSAQRMRCNHRGAIDVVQSMCCHLCGAISCGALYAAQDTGAMYAARSTACNIRRAIYVVQPMCVTLAVQSTWYT